MKPVLLRAILDGMSIGARFAATYAVLAVGAIGVCLGLWGAVPLFLDDGWLPLEPASGHLYSGLAGLGIGGLIVLCTRGMVGKFDWARKLHQDLRPVARGLSPSWILTLAVLSSVAEEIWFRGLTQAWLGILPQALLFGLLHQVRGPSRWVWMSWTALVGLLMGVMYQLTGSLVGPLIAHALINAINLNYLKNHDPEPDRRSLGGLLGQRS